MKLIKIFSKKDRKNKYKNLKLILVFFGVLALLVLISWLLIFFLKNFLVNDIYAPKHSEEISRPLKAEILFNNEPGVKAFSPEILALINQAKESLSIALYSMDSRELRDEIYKAANRGVMVRLVVSYNKTSSFRDLFAEKNNNILIRELASDKAEGFMHNKFIIADAQIETRAMITGSFNPTNLQELYDPSFIFKTRDEAIISAYNQEFERLFSGQSGRAKLNNQNYNAWQKDINYQNGKIEIWWSPGLMQSSLKTRMMELIYQAQESIDVMIWQVTDLDIAKALIDRAKNGVMVRVITDDSNAWSAVSKIPSLVLESLKNNNLIVVDDAARTQDFLGEIFNNKNIDRNNFNSFFHHHALIIDKKILITGSGNWSYRANFVNDENAMFINIPELVQAYQNSFDFNFEKLHNTQINYNIKNGQILLDNLDSFLNSRLFVLQESTDIKPISQVCLEDIIVARKMSFVIPSECRDKALNIFIIDSTGKVLANRLLGKIFN